MEWVVLKVVITNRYCVDTISSMCIGFDKRPKRVFETGDEISEKFIYCSLFLDNFGYALKPIVDALKDDSKALKGLSDALYCPRNALSGVV